MRIVCPSCEAAYDVPEDRLAPGRAVRCARCGKDWLPAGAAPEPAPPPPPPPPPPPAPPPPPSAPIPILGPPERLLPPEPLPTPRSPNRALAAAWVLTAVAVLGMLVGAVVFRADLMRAFPPSERLYRVLGLA